MVQKQWSTWERQARDRLGDLAQRGVVLKNGQTLHDLYKERTPLYEKYAQITIDCENKNIREVVGEIARIAKR